MSCPRCAHPLESYSRQEGGWCPACEEWVPPDLIEEWIVDEDEFYACEDCLEEGIECEECKE